MTPYLEIACETIDAALFSGDSLHNKYILQEFKDYIERWQKGITEIEKLIEEAD